MKKWLIGFGVLILLSLVIEYSLIPSKIIVSTISVTQAPINSASRILSDPLRWKEWWPGGLKNAAGKSMPYRDSHFQLDGISSNVVSIGIRHGDLSLASYITLISFGTDSTGLEWILSFPSSKNPVRRYREYQTAVEIKKDMEAVLGRLQNFLADPVNIYGARIYKRSTSDTMLLAGKFISKAYPTTADIYRFLEPVQQSIARQGAKGVGYPMVNVTMLADSSYQTQVAIPTNQKLQGDAHLFFRRMVPGNFMVMEIKGGEFAVRRGVQSLENFVSDVGKTKMAIGFELLITNRLTEPDSSQWRTQICVPVVR